MKTNISCFISPVTIQPPIDHLKFSGSRVEELKPTDHHRFLPVPTFTSLM